MKKRQKKKNERALIHVNNIEGLSDEGKKTYVYIKKKYWNKGDISKGALFINDSKDYISFSFIKRKGYKYFGSINNCIDCNFCFLKSWDNKNHIIIKN